MIWLAVVSNMKDGDFTHVDEPPHIRCEAPGGQKKAPEESKIAPREQKATEQPNKTSSASQPRVVWVRGYEALTIFIGTCT